MRRSLIRGALFVFAGWVAGSAYADVNRWSYIGPPALTNAVAVSPGDPNVLYVASGWSPVNDTGSFFRSVDAGSTWAASNQGTTTGRSAYVSASMAVVSTGSSADTIYLGTVVGGIYRSIDGGASWTAKNTGVPAPKVMFGIAVDPFDSNRLVATEAFGRPVLTTDAGDTWSPVGLSTGNYTFPSFAPTLRNRVYAIRSGPAGFARSDDGGSTWADQNAGLAGVQLIQYVVSPLAADTLVGISASSVYKTTDAGLTWTPSSSGITATKLNAIASAAGQRLYLHTSAGTYRSDDFGGTWALVSNAASAISVKSIAVVPGTPDKLYAAAYDSGVIGSNDGGVSWTPLNRGLTAFAPALGTTVANAGTDSLLICTGDGMVYRSADVGLWWAGSQSSNGSQCTAVEVAQSGEVYLGSWFGMDQSLDNGVTWLTTTSSLSSVSGRGVAIDPFDGNNVFMATYSGVYASIDRAKTWSLLTTPFPASTAVAVAAQTPRPLYAANGSALYKTTDASTWSTLPAAATGTITQIEVSPLEPAKLAIVDGSVHESDDAGTTWSALPTPGAAIVRAAFDPVTAGRLYAVSTDGVWVTMNKGVRWRAFSDGLATNDLAGLHQLFVSRSDATRLYAVSATGVFAFTQVPPTVASISPSTGSFNGGDTVTIHGTNFMASSSVVIGGAAATQVQVVDSSTITAVTAVPTVVGAVDVTVENPTLLSGKLAGQFLIPPRHGDANADNQLSSPDVIQLISNLFVGTSMAGNGDANGDGVVAVNDIFYLINYLFAGGPAPVG